MWSDLRISSFKLEKCIGIFFSAYPSYRLTALKSETDKKEQEFCDITVNL